MVIDRLVAILLRIKKEMLLLQLLFLSSLLLFCQGYSFFRGCLRSQWHGPPTFLLKNHVLYATPTRIEGIDYVIDEDTNEEDEEEEMDLADTDLLDMANTEKQMLATARQKMRNVELMSPLSLSSIDMDRGTSTKTYAETLINEGVCRINQCLPPELCTKLAQLIMDELQHSIQQVEQEQVDVFDRFSSLLSSNNRWDLKLPLEDKENDSDSQATGSRSQAGSMIKDALCQLLSKSGAVGPTIKSVFSDRAELFELAAFCTLPGAERQVVHADTLFTKQPVLFVVTG